MSTRRAVVGATTSAQLHSLQAWAFADAVTFGGPARAQPTKESADAPHSRCESLSDTAYTIHQDALGAGAAAARCHRPPAKSSRVLRLQLQLLQPSAPAPDIVMARIYVLCVLLALAASRVAGQAEAPNPIDVSAGIFSHA